MKRIIKRALRNVGLDLRHYGIHNSTDAWLQKLLTTHGVNLVLDVGANDGGYGRTLRDAGYAGKIISFEPLSSAHAELMHQSRLDPLWEVASRMAIGSADADIEINVAGNSSSSSILPMLKSHVNAAPKSAYVAKEKVRVARLDGIVDQLCLDSSIIHLKIDTQGYEHEVLAGTSKILHKVTGLQLELSLTPLYEGQKDYVEMLEFVLGLGFKLWAIFPVFINPHDGRLLQMDAVFFRPQSGINRTGQ